MMGKLYKDEQEIALRVSEVRRQIAGAAERSGRRPEEITLVAATKTQSAERVRAALAAGVDAAGENRVQELCEKWEAGAYEGKPLHFIGHLQQNKVKFIVGRVSLIHSVDSLPLAEAIDKSANRLGIVQDVLLEVNIGKEDTKSGFTPEYLTEPVKRILELSNIVVKGIMVIPPPAGAAENESPGKYFKETRKLYIDNWRNFMHTNSNAVLSMGMSGDYVEAILAGSTMVRVGTGIFGARQ